ncbi:MAG TPA: DNA primase [Patescibacteria group bacterium]|nr:DNA primase [Patescibacteria group bacterium]
MAEPGSVAERVKQQADIVRVVGEYVRLKKSGQNFLGLCPFHQEKTPSFAVHPGKQIYHCFGCGAGGDVFRFVMEMEKISFPEAVRAVAEKCGVTIPEWRGGSAEGRGAGEQRRALVEIHRQAAAFFVRQLATGEGQAARAYLEDRGLKPETIARFGLGWAPSSGEALARHLRGKFAAALLDLSGLFSRDPAGHIFDRFRRRVIFPIAAESGKVVAFGGRAIGEEPPKYLNSPETRIYTKSRVLYNLDRAREAIRKEGFAVLVEGYMDAIALAEAGVENVAASCGTSLAETQARLLARFTRNVVVNYDVDAAGQAATDRSLALLLGEGFDVRVLALPARSAGKTDPDQFVREEGVGAYRELLGRSPLYLDYLIARARQMDTGTIEEKLRGVNFLLPYVRLLSSPLARSEWASRVASELKVDQAALRELLQRAAAERKVEVKARPELLAAAVTPAERRLLKMLLDADATGERLAEQMRQTELHRGLETEPIFAVLLDAVGGERPDAGELTALGERLHERHRRLLFELAFEPAAEANWEEAESCLSALKRRRLEAELRSVQTEIEALKAGRVGPSNARAELARLLERKQTLRVSLERMEG